MILSSRFCQLSLKHLIGTELSNRCWNLFWFLHLELHQKVKLDIIWRIFSTTCRLLSKKKLFKTRSWNVQPSGWCEVNLENWALKNSKIQYGSFNIQANLSSMVPQSSRYRHMNFKFLVTDVGDKMCWWQV